MNDVDNKAWHACAGLGNICKVPETSNFVVNPIPQYKYFLKDKGKKIIDLEADTWGWGKLRFQQI